MKNQVKMKPSIISKAILFFGCLFAGINLYGQYEAALNVSSEPSQPAEGPFVLQRESRAAEQPAQPVDRQAEYADLYDDQYYQPGETFPAAADEKPADSVICGKHQFSVWGAGGWQTLFYSPTFGDRKFSLGGAFGIGYTYYFSDYFGVLLGAELAFYNAKVKIDGLTDNYPVTDHTGILGDGALDVDYRTGFYNYVEKQRMMNLNIPIALQFQSGGHHKFFASLGFKLGIPLSGKYWGSEGELVTHGYYEEWNQLFYEPRYLGYGTWYGDGDKKNVDFGLSYMGTAEAGVKWRLNKTLSLYTGLYFEYGFNNVLKEDNGNQFLVYNPTDPGNPEINSILTSQYTSDGQTESFVDKVSPLAVGVKLRLAMDMCKKVKQKEPEDTTKVVQPIDEQPVDEGEPVRERFVRLADEEMGEDLRRAVAEYGTTINVRGTATIRVESFFELDKSTLTREMERILDRKVDSLRMIYGTNISIIAEGHTCDLGTDLHNLRLGQRRAETIRSFLISRGFNGNRITAVSKGPFNPIVPNTSEENRRLNRRVVLIIY